MLKRRFHKAWRAIPISPGIRLKPAWGKLHSAVIGEVRLQHINDEAKECELSIHLQNDSVKGRGYGTQAERLAVAYAFDRLGMERVLADAIVKNTRSRHILEKLGFRFLREADGFRYYCLDRESRNPV